MTFCALSSAKGMDIKMKEHLKKIKETIDVEHGYSLGTVFTTRNKQYMYDTGE